MTLSFLELVEHVGEAVLLGPLVKFGESLARLKACHHFFDVWHIWHVGHVWHIWHVGHVWHILKVGRNLRAQQPRENRTSEEGHRRSHFVESFWKVACQKTQSINFVMFNRRVRGIWDLSLNQKSGLFHAILEGLNKLGAQNLRRQTRTRMSQIENFM